MLVFLLILPIFHILFIYPLILFIISIFVKTKDENDVTALKKISYLIPAFNEQELIEKKIRNILDQVKRAFDDFEIIIVNDGSTDRTKEILEKIQIQESKIKVIHSSNQGKWNALKNLSKAAEGDILVFTDVSAFFPHHFEEAVLKAFKNKNISVYAPAYNFAKKNTMRIWEKIYWPFERLLKALESNALGTLGAHGAAYAIRKNALVSLADLESNGTGPINDDFMIPTLSALKQKSRILYDRETQVLEAENRVTIKKEISRRDRIVRGNVSMVINLHRKFFRNKFFYYSFILFSHKTLRVLLPIYYFVLLVYLILVFPLQIKISSFILLVVFLWLRPFRSTVKIFFKEGLSPEEKWQ